MKRQKQAMKTRLVQELGEKIAQAAMSGQLVRSSSPQPITITRIKGVCGYRYGAIEVAAGLDSGRLLRALSRDDCASFRVMIPWNFPSAPAVYMRGPYVRAEAGWSSDLADKVIRLSEANSRPEEPWRWLAGKDEQGGTIRPGLYDQTPHWLFSGTTGAGKSVAMRGAIMQLAQSPQNKIALLDGKYGEGLGALAHLAVGPVATELAHAKAVLTWAAIEMRRRYESKWQGGKLVIVIDEVQSFTNDAGFVDLLRRLTAQGRAASCHVLAGTQHPSLEVFGDTVVRRNLSGRVALRTADPEASRVATGSNAIRSDLLLGAGDAYVITPAATHRAQIFYVDDRDFGQANGHEWEIQSWDDLDISPGDVGQELPTPKRGTKKCPTAAEVGASLIAAADDAGRPAMLTWMEENSIAKPGSNRAYKLHRFGRKLLNWLESHDRSLTYVGDDWDDELS